MLHGGLQLEETLGDLKRENQQQRQDLQILGDTY